MPGAAERRGVARGAASAWREGGASLVAVRGWRRGAEVLQQAKEAVAAVGAARVVRRARPETLDEAVAFADTFGYGGIAMRPQQVPSELRALLELLQSERPGAVVEIGTGSGGTLFLFAAVAQADATLISIDAANAEGVFGGRRAYKRRARFYSALGAPDQRVVFFAADSHLEDTRRRVERALAGRPLDLLFVDGDHSLEGVAADFQMYSPLVRKGGLVAFHDIVPGRPEDVGGVPEFWRGLRGGDSLELVHDWNQGGCGIGVLRV